MFRSFDLFGRLGFSELGLSKFSIALAGTSSCWSLTKLTGNRLAGTSLGKSLFKGGLGLQKFSFLSSVVDDSSSLFRA